MLIESTSFINFVTGRKIFRHNGKITIKHIAISVALKYEESIRNDFFFNINIILIIN